MDGDGILSDEEIQKTDYIDVTGKGIKSLKGIEYFTALESLICNENKLTELDLINNPLLSNLECDKNKLTKLDLTHNPLLFLVSVEENDLTELLFGQNPNLRALYCDCNSRLSRLDISGCPSITNLLAYCNALEELDLSGCKELKYVYLNGQPNSLKTLKLGYHPSLKVFLCSAEYLKKVDFSGCPVLEELSLSAPKLTSIKLGSKPELTSLSIVQAASLQSIDITGCAKLVKLTTKSPDRVSSPGHIMWQKRKGDTVLSVTLPAGTKYINGLGEKISKLTLNKKKATLAIGDTLTLKLTIKPLNAVNQPVKWKSSNTKIATVDKNGKIKALKKGTCYITCTAADGSGIEVKCKITVKQDEKRPAFAGRLI